MKSGKHANLLPEWLAWLSQGEAVAALLQQVWFSTRPVGPAG